MKLNLQIIILTKFQLSGLSLPAKQMKIEPDEMADQKPLGVSFQEPFYNIFSYEIGSV